ncbi:MAG: transposase [Verrucomicrobiota bacterium]
MRTARIKVEGQTAVYHCISRCVGGMFLLKDKEKEVLRKQIWQVAEFCGVEVITYAIMSNHFHILVRVPLDENKKNISDVELVRRFALLYPKKPAMAATLQSTLSKGGVEAEYERQKAFKRMGDVSFFMKELKQRFTIWYNKSRAAQENEGKTRYGTVWAERFKSVLMENSEAALAAVAAYIDLNCVRAKLVSDPKDYRWCGYGEAVAGSKKAQSGLKAIYDRVRWDATQRVYRTLLVMKGAQVTKAQVRTKRGQGGERFAGSAVASYDPEQVKKVVAEGGRLSLPQVLRCRVRYMSDGAVLGSKEFVDAWFRQLKAQKQREKEQARRKGISQQKLNDTKLYPTYENRTSASRKMIGADWGDLTVFRDLKNNVFS